MQKLLVEFENTPGNASQVPCFVSRTLNRDKSLSVLCIVLANNSSEEDQHSGKSGQALSVPVINMHGKPLMPTRPRKARVFLKEDKAIVVQRSPFTIQLKYSSGETKQALKLGIDAEYSNIGFSTITAKSELLSGDLTLRKRISKLIEQKSNYRKTRRSRLWYRKGHKPSVRRKRYRLQSNDLVRYIKSLCKVKGIQNYGEYVILVTKIGKIFDINAKKVELVKYGKGIQF
ncbi:hypothetical protein IPdc08_01020 [archaeon]|nr:hypothetical protein IPdc08_01020 [archaeon]